MMRNRSSPLFYASIAVGLVLGSATILYSTHHHWVPAFSLASDHAAGLWANYACSNGKISREEPCDPTLTHGYIKDLHWESMDSNCPAPDIITLIGQTPLAERWDRFPNFRNKSILLLGDSLTRHVYNDMCGVMGGRSEGKNADDWKVQYSEAAICEEPSLGFKIASFHTYGFFDVDDSEVKEIVELNFDGSIFRMEDRLARLFGEMIPGYTPDYIQISGAAWDFRYMYARDCIRGERHDDMATKDLLGFRRRLIQYFSHLSSLFPNAKIVYTHAPITGTDDFVLKKAWGNRHLDRPGGKDLEEDQYPPLFTIRRQTQLSEWMKQVCLEEGFDSIDYRKIQNAIDINKFYNSPGDIIHPQPIPRRVFVGLSLLKFQRWVEYGL